MDGNTRAPIFDGHNDAVQHLAEYGPAAGIFWPAG